VREQKQHQEHARSVANEKIAVGVHKYFLGCFGVLLGGSYWAVRSLPKAESNPGPFVFGLVLFVAGFAGMGACLVWAAMRIK